MPDRCNDDLLAVFAFISISMSFLRSEVDGCAHFVLNSTSLQPIPAHSSQSDLPPV